MTTHPNDVAYPLVTQTGAHLLGLTKRELFAAMVMQGLLSNPDVSGHWGRAEDAYAKTAVGFADALIKELSNTTSPS